MFKPTTRERFREMLEILPHAHREAKGFLGGKPSDHHRCTVTGEVRATYPAFIEHQGRYYVSLRRGPPGIGNCFETALGRRPDATPD